MSVLILAALVLPGGLATALLGNRRGASFAVGLATAVIAVIAAASIRAEDTVPLAGSVIGGSDGLRTIAVAWAAAGLLFGIIDGLLGNRADTLASSMLGLGVASIGLSVADAGIGFAVLTAGALVSLSLPFRTRRGGSMPVHGADLSAIRPALAAGLIGLVIVAWGASAVGPFAALGPLGEIDALLATGMGLALLAVTAAVMLRLGAIPAHVWAARFADTMPASAVPPVLGWGAAAFMLVALGWVDVTIATTGAALPTERAAITGIAMASIVLGGLAALLHDDLEHVLAYSIVQDAGVALLAFASADVTVAALGRDWVIASVALKSGLAAWVGVTRATFGSNRRTQLGGWARRAPVLGVALGLVLVGAIGLPGMANADARAALINLAFGDRLGAIVLVIAFAPVVYLGRLLLVGLGSVSDAVRGAPDPGLRLDGPWTGGWAPDRLQIGVLRGAVRTNRLPLAAAAAVLAAVMGLSVAVGGMGSTIVGEGQADGASLPAVSGAVGLE